MPDHGRTIPESDPMRHCFILSMAAFLFAAAPAAAFDLLQPDTWFAPSSCVPEVPGVRVLTSEADVALDHSVDHNEIDRRARTLSMAVKDGWVTNGLATANLLTAGEMVTREYRLSDGGWCVSLASAEFTVEYESPIRVLISSKYAPGSCPYNVILEHEIRHVRIYKEVLARHLSGASGRLAERLRLAGPVRARTLAEAKDRMDATVNAAVDEIADGITREARARNAALDTPESYFQIQSLCPDW
jgi:hypothetical protein